MDAEVSTHTFLTMIIEESVCFMSCEPIFSLQLFLCGTHGIYIYILFFINWTLRMSDNLPERVQFLCHVHIICITVLENRIICCQIFCDLLLKSAFERIFNVMQLILVKIRWHIKWKYLIQNSTIFAFHITLIEMSKTVIVVLFLKDIFLMNWFLKNFKIRWTINSLHTKNKNIHFWTSRSLIWKQYNYPNQFQPFFYVENLCLKNSEVHCICQLQLKLLHRNHCVYKWQQAP